MMKNSNSPIKSTLLITVLCFSQAAHAAAPYILSELAGIISQPKDINGSGVVVGSDYVNDSSIVHAISWTSESVIDIGALNQNNSSANGINDSGQIAGASFASGNGYHATVWNGLVATDLHPSGYRESFALDINNSGQVVGYLKPTDSFYAIDTHKAVLWSDNQLTQLNTLGGTGSHANRINLAGQIVGWSFTSTNNELHATRWDNKSAIDLGTLGGIQSEANDINELNQAVGWSYIKNNSEVHATLWNGEVATDLGTLGGSSSFAYAINNHGIAVGVSRDASNRERAVLWGDHGIVDLNTLLSADDVNAGWVLTNAYAINDGGNIVGEGYNQLSNKRMGFMLAQAIPEPTTYSLMFMGLCFIGFATRRRTMARVQKD